MTAPDAASLRQVEAADPRASTWLAANAGSGKTRVLTDRVARLLLDGTAPQRILCLTYTRAAAGEMQNRLFAQLGGWAMLPAERLRAELSRLGAGAEGALDDAALARARRLFARAIETPGGLKIQTIHAFCGALLRRFPLEAGVSPRFAEMDTRSERLLQEEVLEVLAETAPGTFDALAAELGGTELARLAGEIVRNRAGFATPLDRAGARAAFGLPAGLDAAALLAEVLQGGEAELVAALVAGLTGVGKADASAAEKLAVLRFDPPDLGTLEGLEGVLLFGASAKSPFGAKIGQFPTKDSRARLAAHMPALEALMLRVEAARPRRLALVAAERAAALHAFAAAFLPEFDRRKAARGWIGFDDLIERARALLSDASVAQWVLYKLDGGIDHILVDEAQDTSPAQWAVIERLTEEMTAGEDGRRRTLFVVGDRKQSIYSFQGADLRGFEAVRARFAARLAALRTGLGQLTLEYSFRSSEAVLRAVDLTFDDRRGTGLGGEVRHMAFHRDLPGRVDLWPALAEEKDGEDPPWWEPVDLMPAEAATARLARAIAAEIARMLREGVPLPAAKGAPRPVRPGDFLILVRRRSALFHRIIVECKALGLPMAGADRMNLGAEVAVRDLTALMAFLATPEDDLSLAAVLRSPLAGWSEAQLYTLAHGRRGFLWEALRGRADGAATRAWLTDLRDAADYLRPYELLERALVRHGGRQRLLARLGAEAEEGIDALLAQALAYETTEVPSLTGFLGWLAAGEVEVKRRPDDAGNRIRVMTVHGAKGLEAPIVILPDTAERKPPRGDALIRLAGDGPAVWTAAREAAPPPLAAAQEAVAAARAEEDARLLYVAMTRAECWLIAAAAGKTEQPDCWHARLRAGLEHAGAVTFESPLGPGLRLEHGAWPEVAAPTEAPAPTARPPLPDWLRRPAPAAAPAPAPLTPTGLGGAKALPGEAAGPADEAAALARGRRLHLLLEHLPLWPEADWQARAADLMAAEGAEAEGPAAGAAGTEALLAEARAILKAPDLAFLFAPEALAEVEIAAGFGGRRLVGVIDRLVVEPDRVLAVDWKSNAVVPGRPEEVPEGLLRQMAAYAEALAQVWPGRRVEVALLWTRTARLMPLPAPLLAAARGRALAELAGAGRAGIDPGKAGP